MAVYPEDLVPKRDHKKEHYYDFRVVDRGLLIDYYTERVIKNGAKNAKNGLRIAPQISVLIDPEQSVVTIWGARRCSYKAHPGGHLDDRTVPNNSRRPVEMEAITDSGDKKSYLFHQEVNHKYLRGPKTELNAFLLVVSSIQITVQPTNRYVMIFYADRVFCWNGTNPGDLIFLHDDVPTADYRPDELYLAEKDKGHLIQFPKTAS
ncbi:MAG: hypothetical protein KW802_01335 [Candidatus Doudnabacteria bacterium]|nr:hypothetical protein [Candidatus Doudnabacteria bacterium]